MTSCEAPSGFVATADDCDDTSGTVYPGAAEICDEIDNDCSGVADDDCNDLPDDPHKWTIAPFANHAGTAGYADGDVATAAFRSPGGL